MNNGSMCYPLLERESERESHILLRENLKFHTDSISIAVSIAATWRRKSKTLGAEENFPVAMAISTVVSHRNFGCFIGSGRVYHRETPSDHQRCRHSSISAVQYVNKKMFCSKLYHPAASFSFGYVYQSSIPAKDKPNREIPRSKLMSHLNLDPVLITSHQTSNKLTSMNKRVKRRGAYECCLSSAYSDAGGIQTRKLDKLGFSYGQKPPSKHITVMRTRAEFKSEEHNNTSTEFETLLSSEGASEAALPVGAEPAKPWGSQLPKRWVMVLLCFTAFLLCNMDRVNMSIAILPMSKEFNWSSATVGLIQSSFFWGYLLTQIIGGIWADKIGGKLVLGFGVVWWSLATILTPIAARIGLPCLLVTRAFMGVGEGVAMPAMNNLLSRWIPVSERSRSLALVYSGMYLGSVAGLAVSPVLIHKFGWPSVFYSFGSLGSIWFALWLSKAHSSPQEDPSLSLEEKKLILGGNISKEPVSSIPWKKILSKAPVWALIISHFCHNWGTFILLTWMPTYYNQVLNFNLTESGLLCVLPWLTMAVFANIGGWVADTLISRGFSITSVRKIMQSIGFLGPAFFLTQLGNVKTPALAVLCMACSQGSDAFSQSGLYSNHQDIGPRYAGVLLGLSNTAGVLAGVFGTAATGYILQHGSWNDVFKVAVVLYIVGTIVWNLFSTGEKILD